MSLNKYLIKLIRDLIVYLIVFITMNALILLKQNFKLWVITIIISLYPLGLVVENIKNIIKTKLIHKQLKRQNLLEKIGNIEFWNKKDYALCTNYILIINNKKVIPIEYKNIKEIYIKKYLKNVRKKVKTEEYLHLILKDNTEFKILIWTNKLKFISFKAIIPYLLKKNSKIKVTTSIENNK